MALLFMVIFVIVAVGPSFMQLKETYNTKTITQTNQNTVNITDDLSSKLLSYNESKDLGPSNITILVKDSTINKNKAITLQTGDETSLYFDERRINITYITTTENKTFVKYTYPRYYSLTDTELFIQNNIFYIFLIISSVTCIYLLITALQLLYSG